MDPAPVTAELQLPLLKCYRSSKSFVFSSLMLMLASVTTSKMRWLKVLCAGDVKIRVQGRNITRHFKVIAIMYVDKF